MNSSPKQGLGIVLRRERDKKGMSRGDLAEASGLSYPYMSELESGSKYPSDRALENIAAALDIDPFNLERLAREAEPFVLSANERVSPPLPENAKGLLLVEEGHDLEDRLVHEALARIEPIIRNAIRTALREPR